jgi:hypothetical protein
MPFLTAGYGSDPRATIKLAGGDVPDIPTRVGKIYSFGPEGYLFSSPVQITLSYAAYSANTQTSKLGMYYWNETEGVWEYVPATVNENLKEVSATTTHFSRYSLATDVMPPQIDFVTPEQEAPCEPIMMLEVWWNDDLSGLDTSTIVLALDEQPLDLGEAVITDSTLSYQLEFENVAIRHVVVMTAHDMQGNETSVTLEIAEATAVHMSGLAARVDSARTVTVSWNALPAAGCGSFGIERSREHTGRMGARPTVAPFTQIASIPVSLSCERYEFTDKSVTGGSTYSYRIVATGADGEKTTLGPVTVTVRYIPKTYYLGQNFPNPFNPATTVFFDLPRKSQVTVRIFNVTGQLVRTLVDAELPVGRHKVVWDGKNSRNQRVSSGVYFYQFKAGSVVKTKRMLLIK